MLTWSCKKNTLYQYFCRIFTIFTENLTIECITKYVQWGGFLSDENNNVLLIITDDKMKAFFTVRDPESVNKELIDKLVRDKGVKYGIDKQVLDDLIKSPSEGTFLFATGTPPKEGQDGYVQYLFSSRVVRSNEQDQQNVDFREVFNVPSVTANTVLAVYHPAVKGEDGRMVTGQVIAARKVVELTLRAAKGTVLSNDGMMVSSQINGRPRTQKKGIMLLWVWMPFTSMKVMWILNRATCVFMVMLP